MNSKYVISWNVQLLPNGIYELIFNTTERWVEYHRMNDRLYIFGEDVPDETQEYYESRMQEIPEFLPHSNEVMYVVSSSQDKEQIIFYFIPFEKSWLKKEKIKTILNSKDYVSII